MKKLLTMALVACLIGGLPLGGDRAQADSHSVLKLARGLASDNITVLIGRAIVVESAQPFIEVSVASPDVADVSPLSDRSIYIFGKARGATTLTLLGENGALITNVTIKVVPDLAELKQRLKDMLPNEPIDVRLSGGGVVLSGIVSGKAKVTRAMALANSYVGKSAINMMSVGGTQQVMLKVRIAEMARSAAKELGFDAWITGAADSGKFAGIGLSGNNLEFDGAEIGVIGDITTTVSGYGALGFIAQLGDLGIGLTLQALEQKGFSRTLAEPNLIALSGNQASFLAGQEVPIPQVTDDNTLKITYKPIGVALNFTPTVLDDDLINLELSTEVSAIDSTPGASVPISAAAGNNAPIFTVRRATTVIELRDGQSFAIAGLLKDDFTDAISQFPWLGDIPILGTLFRSTNYSRGETELVIIVSAHLVVPVGEEELSVPHDRVRIPNELELFLLGHTDGSGAPGMVESQGFDGDFGYVVE
ncbi:MAG TPA: type II and III secretion system protein family protein [Hyphomicrobiaceae bacterium]|nr:type II and III secretion system protein family protein [Hyphomicrobiaceae bacterium]